MDFLLGGNRNNNNWDYVRYNILKVGEKMKSEIKQRIEQIKNGQVPKGYKK